MKVVVQRIRQASVIVRGETIAHTRKGLLLLVGIDEGDTEETVRKMADQVLKLRIFGDEEGKMNYSVLEVGGEVLLVPNFTLSANTEKGNRPSFATAAAPNIAEGLFNTMAEILGDKISTQTGEFGAEMQVKLQNDGPVTFILES